MTLQVDAEGGELSEPLFSLGWALLSVGAIQNSRFYLLEASSARDMPIASEVLEVTICDARTFPHPAPRKFTFKQLFISPPGIPIFFRVVYSCEYNQYS